MVVVVLKFTPRAPSSGCSQSHKAPFKLLGRRGTLVAAPLAWLLTCCPALVAQETDAVELHITLRECIALALENNLELDIDRIGPPLALADMAVARGAFEPTFSFEGEYDENSDPLDSLETLDTRVSLPRSRTETYRTGLKQLLPTGATWEVFGESNREETRADIETFEASFGIEIVQPLLRGVGTDVNLAELRIARRERDASVAALKASVAQLLVDVTAAYYELAFARLDYEAREDSLKLAEQLLADNQARVEVGTMSPLDVTQAQSELAARRQELIASERAIIVAENTLRRLIYRDVAAKLATSLVAVTTPQPEPIRFDASTIVDAYAARPELRTFAERVEQAKLRVNTAKNGLLPAVDLRFSARAFGTGTTFGTSIPRSQRFDEPSWAAGVTVEVPLGLSTERGRRDRAQLELKRALLEFDVQRQDIAVEVSNAAGAVRVSEKQYAAAREAVRLAQESLTAEEEKLRVGRSTTFLVTQFQRDLAVARSTELRSLADWHQSVAEFHRVRGAILDVYRVRIEE